MLVVVDIRNEYTKAVHTCMRSNIHATDQHKRTSPNYVLRIWESQAELSFAPCVHCRARMVFSTLFLICSLESAHSWAVRWHHSNIFSTRFVFAFAHLHSSIWVGLWSASEHLPPRHGRPPPRPGRSTPRHGRPTLRVFWSSTLRGILVYTCEN
jgi:hypothetical protein